MSIEWLKRTAERTPLTSQEEMVRGILVGRNLSFKPHYVFDFGQAGRHPVDFLVFLGPGLVIECTRCGTARGRAMSEIRRRAVFMQYWFALIRSVFPNIRCVALVEAPNEKPDKLAYQLKLILKDADFFARTGEEFGESIAKFGRGA
ncbi:MAG: hypothetical protein OK455_01695 [Thaumarchaeota archaeon]|nr:hypothetical protein [Nitrososphaerota archaeon]